MSNGTQKTLARSLKEMLPAAMLKTRSDVSEDHVGLDITGIIFAVGFIILTLGGVAAAVIVAVGMLIGSIGAPAGGTIILGIVGGEALATVVYAIRNQSKPKKTVNEHA